MSGNTKFALVLATAAVFLGTGWFVGESAPKVAKSVFFGGINTVYVPPIVQCPQHIWIRDFVTGASYAVTDIGSLIYRNGGSMRPGAFILGSVNPFPNPPCLIQVTPPIYLPYPLFNLIYEGTS